MILSAGSGPGKLITSIKGRLLYVGFAPQAPSLLVPNTNFGT